MAAFGSDSPLFDYQVYRFGEKQQLYRGPVPDLRGRYIAYLGATATFGRFVERPFAQVVAEETGLAALNLGADGAGPGFFLQDADVLQLVEGAALCVLEVMGADAISNRMYSVRPRRNARLHTVSDLLRGIYPELDLDDIGQVSRLLAVLSQVDEQRFRLVENEIKNAWIGRTLTLIGTLTVPVILLWLSERQPGEAVMDEAEPHFLKAPHFVDAAMVEAATTAADGYAECVSAEGLPQDLTRSGEPVLFRASGQPILANLRYPSPEMHARAAERLVPEVERLLRRR